MQLKLLLVMMVVFMQQEFVLSIQLQREEKLMEIGIYLQKEN